jgi:hypothetical protein
MGLNFNTIGEIIDYIDVNIRPNDQQEITGEKHQNVAKGLAEFFPKYNINNETATIKNGGGVLVLDNPFTIISGTVPTSVQWPGNVFNQYYIVNTLGVPVPLAEGFSYSDTGLITRTAIPAQSIAHIIKAINGSWVQVNVAQGSQGVPGPTGNTGPQGPQGPAGPSSSSALYNNHAALAATSVVYSQYDIIAIKGFNSPNDGGHSEYIVLNTPLSGLDANSPAQIPLPGGKYARLYHGGEVNLEQFGAIGDGTVNDYNAFYFANNMKVADNSVNKIFGNAAATYNLQKRARAMANVGGFNFDLDCFLRVEYGGCTWDGRGAKILWNNNATQSYVYYTIGGITNIYRCKFSNIGEVPNNVLYWGAYYWQIMVADVVPDGTYPFWNGSTQYYGAQNFCHLGYGYGSGRPKIKDVYFLRWDISGMESDSVAVNSGMWNIFAKGFNLQYNYDNVFYEGIELHHIASEMFYGGAESEAGRQTIIRCKIYKGHNGISGGGYPFYILENIFEDLSANAVENFPFDGKLVVADNDIKRCGNGLTIGGPGNDLQVQGDVTLDNNRIEDCLVYGIYFSGRARGVTVANNKLYDTGISFYMLSNLGFPMVCSEYMVIGNQIYAKNENVTFGMIFNSAYSDIGDYTSNIFLKSNVFGSTALSQMSGGSNATMGTAISFYGDLYKDVVISDNSFVGRITQFYEYVVKNENFSPIFIGNSYRCEYSDNHIVGVGFGTAYNAPTSFDQRYINGDNQCVQVGGAPPFNGWGTAFFQAPPLRNLYYTSNFGKAYIGCYYSTRTVIMPSGNDNLKRAYIMWSTFDGNKRGVSLNLIQSNTVLERADQVGMRSWEYQGMTESITMPDVMAFSASEYVFGNIAPGEVKQYGFYSGICFNSDYDQYFPDRDYANNVLLKPGIEIVEFQINYSGSFNMTVFYKNNTGSPISQDGGVIAWKAYPVSKPDKLPTNIAPLREEGMTNMLPTGNVPHRHLFRDVEADEYLEYNKATNIWVAI